MDIKFTKEQNKIWENLFKNQIQNVMKFACKEYLHGFGVLKIPSNHIPKLDSLNSKIKPSTNWSAVRTEIRYSDALPWYQHFSRHEFIVTNYLRDWNEFNFTPEPDMFHDIFGHLSFLVLPEYTEIFDMFSSAFLKANKEERINIGKLAWFSYEFGIIKSSNELKIFGAGILSSIGETKQVMNGKTKLREFRVESVLKNSKAITNYNSELFYFSSMESLKKELRGYLNPIASRKINPNIVQTIIDKEMFKKGYNI